MVPDTLLARDESQKTRELLLQEGLEYLYHCGTAFKAAVSTIIFVVSKGSKSKEVHSEILEGSVAQMKHKCNKERFLSDPKHRFLIQISDEEANIFSRIENECEPLQNFVRISRGEEIGKKDVHSQGPIPIIAGDDISSYFIRQPSRFLYTLKKEAQLYEAPKIVMLKTGIRCIAALDRVGYVTLQSVYNLHLNVPEIVYETILALLNSRFVYCFVYKTFTSYKGLFPQLNQSTIQEIPIPLSIFTEQEELVSLVQEIHCFKGKLNNVTTAQEENFLSTQIQSIDRKMDQLIYDLYGLSADEIAVIENGILS